MAVFVLDKCKKPLMPCSEKRARLLLARGRARVHRMVPFTIRLVDRLREDSVLQPLRLKIDPGGKTTGLALVREAESVTENGDSNRTTYVVALMELQHRGYQIRRKLYQRRGHRNRRRRHLWYRPSRFRNRTRSPGWLPPSVRHRVDSVATWIYRLKKWTPLSGISLELPRFDMRRLTEEEVDSTDRQRDLSRFEARAYLLKKYGKRCAYCGAQDVPLTIDHIYPRSRGGSNRLSNLTVACIPCNQRKGSRSVSEFLAHDLRQVASIEQSRQKSLKEAAAVNTSRSELLRCIEATGLDIETGSGVETQWNRSRLAVPKAHCLDAACVGKVDGLVSWKKMPVLVITATGRGRYGRTMLDSNGFPKAYLIKTKGVFGFQTGDLVRATVTRGKNQGIYIGSVAISAIGYFKLNTLSGKKLMVSHRYCKLIQRSDGYRYHFSRVQYDPSPDPGTFPDLGPKAVTA